MSKYHEEEGNAHGMRDTDDDARFQALLDLHDQWLRTEGEEGSQLDLKGADLSGKEITDTILVKAILDGANLEEADLYGALLMEASMIGANLSGAQLRKARLDDAILRGANLRGVRATRASFWDTDLSDADLTGADLGGAALRGANLTNAILRDADLGSSELTGARLHGTVLRGARGLDSAQVEWIEIGTDEHPIQLSDDEALEWLVAQAEGDETSRPESEEGN
jgi:2-iminobutanoate/2-iminopropanoate deaminase